MPSKYKVINWFLSTEKIIFYGIDTKVDGKWCHLLKEANMPAFFDTEEEAKKYRKQLLKEDKNDLSNNTNV